MNGKPYPTYTPAIDPTARRRSKASTHEGARKMPTEGFIASACKNGKHPACPSLKCSCGCHKIKAYTG